MQHQIQPDPQDSSSLLYRVFMLESLATQLQAQVNQLQAQLKLYVPVRENELQLQSIRSTVERVERDVQEIRKQTVDLNTKIDTAAATAVRDQDKLQIGVLRYIVATIVGVVVIVVGGIVIYYLTRPGG